MMMHKSMFTVTLGLVLACGVAWPQAGPKRETGDPVAKPRRPEASKTEEKAEPAQQEKIPSKLNKPKEAGQAEGPTFRSDTLSVNVDVGVLDNKGRFIPGIPAGNFRIMEDGVPKR